MSAESLDNTGGKPNGTKNDHLLYGNILHEDPLGVSNRRISILSDEIASAQMFGGDTSAKQQELQGEIDMRDYLMSRDYKDVYDHIHDAETNRFKSLSDVNRGAEITGDSYKDMPINTLIDKWAEAEDNNDKTTSGNIQDELQERLINIPTIAEDNNNRDTHGVTEDHKMDFIDVMHRDMMSRRKNVDNSETSSVQSGQESSVGVIDEEIDTTTPGEEGHRNEFYENEIDNTVKPEATPQNPAELLDEEIDTTTPGAEGHRNEGFENGYHAPIEQSKPTKIEVTEPKTVDPIEPEVTDDNVKPEGPLTAALNINISENIARAANREAEARLQQDKMDIDEKIERKTGGKGRVRKILAGIIPNMVLGMTKNYRLRKYRMEAEDRLTETLDFIDNDIPVDARAKAKQDLFDQFKSQYDESIHTESGEKRELLSSDHELAIGAKDLIRRYLNGEFRSDSDLEEARNRLINDYRNNHKDEAKEKFGEGELAVSDLVEIAKTASGMIEHGESADFVVDNIQFVVGEARSGARTEVRHNIVERAYQRLARSKFGSMASGATILAGVSMAMSIARYGGDSVVGAATKVGLVSFGAALISGFKKNKEIKDNRANHQIDLAEGRSYEKGKDSVRDKIDVYNYELASAKGLTEQLNSLSQQDTLANGGEEAVRAALGALAAIEARIRYSDDKKKDLLSYSNPSLVIQERLGLDIARAKAKSELSSHITPEMRQELGIGPDANIQEIINVLSGETIDIIDTNVSEKDAAFNKFKRKEVVKAGVRTAVIGAAIGILIQEGGAIIDNTRAGLIEQLWGANNIPVDGEMHNTILAGLFAGPDQVQHFGPSSDFIDNQLANNGGVLRLSSESSLIDNNNGTFDILDHNSNVMADNIPFNPDGSMPDTSIDQLRQLGLDVTANPVTINHQSVIDKVIKGDDFMDQFKDSDLVHFLKRFHYDNDTNGKFDLNELKLWWGGGGDGIDASGNYVFDVSHMKQDGSFADGLSTEWKTLAEAGELKLYITASTGTQSQALEVLISPDGIATIDPSSPAAELFSVEGSHAVFNGAFVEVGHKVEDLANGVERVGILATHVGNNDVLSHIQETIITPETIHNYDIITPGYDVVTDNFVEMSPVIPVESIDQMKRAFAKQLKNPEIYPMYYGVDNMKLVTDWLRENPERLKTRVQKVDAEGNVSWVESDGSPVERSVNRERKSITDYLDRQKQNNPSHMQTVEKIADSMKPMDKECRVAVNVPAWMEASNLNLWLEQFSSQVDKDGNPLDISKYELNVMVNRKTGSAPDNSVAVIENFIEKYKKDKGTTPNVNFYDIEIDPPNNNVGYARKLVTDAVLLRSIRRNNQDACLYIETEDADVVSADKKTVVNLIDKLDNNPQLDAVRGVQDRDPSKLKENDYLFMRRRACDFFELLARQKRFADTSNPYWNYKWNRVVTGGWNTGYTAEGYADIDGYNSVVAGEDMLIGEKLTMIRGDGNKPNLDVVGKVATRSDSSPRRFIQEVIEGKGAYEDFGNELTNKEIRDKTIPELMEVIKSHARISDTNKVDFSNYINAIHQWTNTVTGGSSVESEQMTRRILFMLGLKKEDYEIDNSNIVVKNWSNFAHSLDSYRKRATA